MMREPATALTEHTFVRVYHLPEKLTNGFCFGRGIPITMMNVDWFECRVDTPRAELEAFIRGKAYYNPAWPYLVLGDHADFTFRIDPEEPVDDDKS